MEEERKKKRRRRRTNIRATERRQKNGPEGPWRRDSAQRTPRRGPGQAEKEDQVTTAIYSLSFIPLLLVVLTVHELGHLIAARLMGIRVSAFQIGIGWTLATVHTGRTGIRLLPETVTHSRGGDPPGTGQLVSIYVSQEKGGEYTAHAVLPIQGKKYEMEMDPEVLRTYNERYMLITGRVREVSQEEITVASVAWSLRAIPLMAGVYLPEDPARRASGVYNTASWKKQTMITLAGPAANIALLVAAVAVMAVIPVTAVYAPIMTVRTVAQGSPAELAGVRPGDHVIQVDNVLVPDQEELKRAIFKAMISGRPMRMQLKRGEETVMAEIYPDQVTGRIGVNLAAYMHPPRRHSMKPGDVGSRFASLGMVYFKAAKLMVDQFGEERAAPALSGPVAAAYYTAQAIEYARFRAWLAILAAVTLGTAALNLLPVPPLDGYRLVTQSVQAARRGKEMDPRLERAMVMGGLCLIIATGVYLVFNDIMHLLE